MKTKADYDGEGKKGKLRSPKIAEFSISIIEGVSERLKVRVMWLPLSVSCITSISVSSIFHTSTHAYAREQTAAFPAAQGAFVTAVIILPLRSK